MNNYQLLDWDSDFFGFTVARILPAKLSLPELEKTLQHLKQDAIALAYWASDPADGASQLAARRCGGFLADKKVTFITDVAARHQLSDSVAVNAVVEEYAAALPTNELEDLAVQAGLYSRFKVDPRIPTEKFIALYKMWIRNSVSRKIADAVLVIRNEGKIVGMVTVGEKNSRADIGLIAVDASMRGKKIGLALVMAALAWAQAKGFTIAQVVTQGENIAACRLYEACGYHSEKIENIYHFWTES